MERAAWTDERLSDLAEAMRPGFARVDQDIRDLRSEMHDGFSGLGSELRSEMHHGFSDLRAEINSLRLVMRVGGGIIIALIGVIAAILARGA